MIGMFAIGRHSAYGYLVYESQALLINQLPHTIEGWQRELAAWFLSVAIHLTILTTAANSKLVHKAFPVLFALAGYFITTLFFEAWDWAAPRFEKSRQDIFVSQLFSLLIAVINYLFVYLFVGKWKELKGEQQYNEDLQKAKQSVGHLSEELTQLTKRNEELTESKQALTKLQQAFAKQQSKHQEELQLVNENRMCINCGFKADTYQQLSRYKRDCEHCVNVRKKKHAHNAKVG